MLGRIIGLQWGSASFLMLFFGFFVYHQMLATGLMPAFLGGYFGVVSLLTFIALLPIFIIRSSAGLQNKININLFDYLFYGILLIIFFISFVGYAVGDLAGNEDLLFWSVSGAFFNFVVYLISRCYEFSISNRRALMVVAVVMLSIVYFGSIEGRFYVWRPYVDDNATTYQGFGRSLVLCGFLLIAYSRHPAMVAILLASFVPALFLNGGRTELVLFIISSFALISYYLIFFRNSAFIISAVVLLMISSGYYVAPILESLLPDSRILELFELSISASAGERSHLTEVALRTISESPIVGSYGSYVLTESSVGLYSHNLLSAWVNLGIFGFLYYVGVMLAGIIYVMKTGVSREVRASTQWRVTFLMAVYMALAFAFSRNYSDELFGFFIGALASLYQTTKCSREVVRTHNTMSSRVSV